MREPAGVAPGAMICLGLGNGITSVAVLPTGIDTSHRKESPERVQRLETSPREVMLAALAQVSPSTTSGPRFIRKSAQECVVAWL